MFDKPNGAFTGEISAEQLSDSKIGWALAGHSERRVILKEGDEVSGICLCLCSCGIWARGRSCEGKRRSEREKPKGCARK